MNKRIKELAAQAGLFSARPEGSNTRVLLAHLPGTDGEVANPDEQLEKFAELIVRECTQRCEDIAIKHQVEVATYASGMKAGAFECASDLKQHFGVK